MYQKKTKKLYTLNKVVSKSMNILRERERERERERANNTWRNTC